MLVDTHCHIQSINYEDVNGIIENASKNDVEVLIVTGYDRQTNLEAIELSNKYDNIYAAIGYHPSEASKLTEEDFTLLDFQLKEPNVVALGEVGLDYYWNKENKETQKSVFIRQILLSASNKKPIVVHCREAINDVLEILKKYKPKGTKGIMHCYNSSFEVARELIELEMLIGVGGVITFKNSKLCEVIKKIDLEYIVLETDSPYLAPDPYRGRKNEPANLHIVAEKLADVISKDFENVAYVTTQNAMRLFDLRD